MNSNGMDDIPVLLVIMITFYLSYHDTQKLNDPTMFAVKAKIYGVLYNQSSSIAFDETSSYWSVPKSS